MYRSRERTWDSAGSILTEPSATGLLDPESKEARFYERLDQGKVRCFACAHHCVVFPGKVGICHVRENQDGKLMSLVYGRACAADVDPIEKKPLYHFYPGSLAYSIATVGCNLHCAFCQNWELSQVSPRRIAGFPLSPEAIVSRAIQSGCRAVAYTYTEPTIFIEYALDTARLARRRGLVNVFVSNGYYTAEALSEMTGLIDAVNIDLKSFRDAYYRKVCGATLKPVLDSIERTVRAGIWVEVTTLVVPGRNDSPDELGDIARFLAHLGSDIPWHVSRFIPAYRLTDVPPTPCETLVRAREIGRSEGLHHVYVGNVWDEPENTLCPECGARLLVREDLWLTENRLVDGACPDCGRPLAGVGLREEVPLKLTAEVE